MTRQDFSDNEKILLKRLESFSDPVLYVIGITGFPGAGKTTLTRRLTDLYQGHATHVSEDDFLSVSSADRKSYLTEALSKGDKDMLRSLVEPSTADLNPYANPATWYDWKALSDCLVALKRTGKYKRTGSWNQTTGTCDQEKVYSVTPGERSFCFVDANYPLLYRDQIDWLVFLNVPENITRERAAGRDRHRSDPVYLDYKQMVDAIYTVPNMNETRQKADQILWY